MKRTTIFIAAILRKVAVTIGILAIICSLGISWFSAHEKIDSTTELLSYFYCFAAVICVAFLYASMTAEPCPRLKKTFVLVGTIFGLGVVITSCARSENTFMFWKGKSISPSEWQEMVTDLKRLGQEETVRGTTGYRYNGYPSGIALTRIPRIFDQLGRQSEFQYCLVPTGAAPYIVYGFRGRCWGLTIGSNLFLEPHWTSKLRVRVSDDGYFFVGTDD